MSTPAKIADHPIHPMLVALPIGMWVFALIGDIVYAAGGNVGWSAAAFYTIGVGILGALAAAIPGLIDLVSMSPSRARTIGIWHMSINLALVGLFAVNFFLRWQTGLSAGTALVLTIIGIAGLLVSGWLGGEMVYVLGTAVKRETDTSARSTGRTDIGRGPGREAA